MSRSTRLVTIALVLAACGREQPAPVQSTAPPAPAPAPVTQSAPPPAQPVTTTHRDASTPQKCGGDGSYEQAINCFRQRASLHFTFDGHRAELARRTPGAERMKLSISGGGDKGEWVADRNPSGVQWSRDGKHTTAVPGELEKLFLRVTLFPDPQKKEGSAQLAGHETVGGVDCNRYEFTDVATNDRQRVWVSKEDGRVVRWSINDQVMDFSD